MENSNKQTNKQTNKKNGHEKVNHFFSCHRERACFYKENKENKQSRTDGQKKNTNLHFNSTFFSFLAPALSAATNSLRVYLYKYKHTSSRETG